MADVAANGQILRVDGPYAVGQNKQITYWIDDVLGTGADFVTTPFSTVLAVISANSHDNSAHAVSVVINAQDTSDAEGSSPGDVAIRCSSTQGISITILGI